MNPKSKRWLALLASESGSTDRLDSFQRSQFNYFKAAWIFYRPSLQEKKNNWKVSKELNQKLLTPVLSYLLILSWSTYVGVDLPYTVLTWHTLLFFWRPKRRWCRFYGNKWPGFSFFFIIRPTPLDSLIERKIDSMPCEDTDSVSPRLKIRDRYPVKAKMTHYSLGAWERLSHHYLESFLRVCLLWFQSQNPL